MRWICLMGLWMVGCDDSFEPATPDNPDEVGDGCPEGLSAASDSSFITTQFTVNGLGLVTDFVTGTTYDDVPAACISADGLSLQLVFEVAGEPFGQVLMSHSGPNSYDANDTVADFALNLFGADIPTVYAAGDWQTASWNVQEDGGAIGSDFFGTGFSGDENTAINLQLVMTP